MKYIATRDGVELITGDSPVTEKPRQLIDNLLRDFPQSRSLDEYGEYKSKTTVSTASVFITAALGDHAHKFQSGDWYMKYIAERPRSHGLFSATKNTNLNTVMEDVSSHPAPVWTFIYSLKREDTARLGYDSAESWRCLLTTHQTEIAETMKIPPKDLR